MGLDIFFDMILSLFAYNTKRTIEFMTVILSWIFYSISWSWIFSGISSCPPPHPIKIKWSLPYNTCRKVICDVSKSLNYFNFENG